MFIRLILLLIAATITNCSFTKTEGSVSEPLFTVEQILKLHGMHGRSAEQRPQDVRNSPIDREKLASLFIGYEKEDPFLADLYVGFVAGALAASQKNLEVFETGKKAEIKAGRLTVHMYLKNGTWKVSLAETVPNEIKIKAKQIRSEQEKQSAIGFRTKS